MPNDFSAEYSQRSDDELLHLASERDSLTIEATAALDGELRRRNLTESDRLELQRFVKRQEQLDARKHRRKPISPFKYQLSWRDILSAFAAMTLISFTYVALPRRYHMKPEWQDAAFIVMITSVLIAFATRRVFWGNSTFWMSLATSSVIHLAVVHAWTLRAGELNRPQRRLAILLGGVLFMVIFGLVRLLRRMFYREESVTTHKEAGGTWHGV